MRPDWFSTEGYDPPCLPSHRSRGRSFLERTLSGAASFFKDTITSSEYAAKNGLLQSIDPRVRVITLPAEAGVWM